MNLQPIQPDERIELLDMIRGIALLGILLVNMAIFSYPSIFLFLTGEEWWDDSLNQAVNWMVTFFAEGKFYPMFSFLFGLGFMLFIQKAEQKGVDASRLYKRRAFILLVIGLIHAIFIWMGDILVFYALLSLLLLKFRHKQPHSLIKWAFSLLLIPALLLTLLLGSAYPGDTGDMDQYNAESEQYFRQLTENALQVYGEGAYSEILIFRIYELFFMYINSIVSLPTILGMFLLGVYVIRRDFFQNQDENKSMLKKAWLTSLMVGLPLSFLQATFDHHDLIGGISAAIGGPAMTLFYLTSFYFLYQQETWRKILRIFAPVGRLGLTNYLFQSIVCTTLFYSYGLGLYGRVSPFWGLVLTVGIYIIQILLSHLWLKRYSFGPMEWAWRRLTYK